MFAAPAKAAPARRLAIAGVIAEGALMQTTQPRATRRVGLARVAKGLSTTGVALLTLRGKRSRRAAMFGSALICAGETCLRKALRETGS